MKNFLEKTLRQNVMIEETEYLNEKLPLAFRGRYTFYKVETNGSPWIAIQPKADVGLERTGLKLKRQQVLIAPFFLILHHFILKKNYWKREFPLY